MICKVTSWDDMGIDAIAVAKFLKWLNVYSGMLSGQGTWTKH